MKSITGISLLLSVLALSACGLRGDLERPDPLWGEPVEETVEETPEVTSQLRPRTTTRQVASSSYRDPNTGQVVWVQNENGGDKPLASPTDQVVDAGGLPPISE